ncbi:glycosyltransferase family 2 protein [Hymenobacter psychrotolerans]|uniref:Glycosyl transferase family 2 n=1 Tax=Hymenobacter psychrotolerans DSM 18569 TaxID=1121959 RepID=A0A1M7BGF6_9BACT|nr:glycosyltransferase family 2 protein [Hymenobacter psychrotolerans]SHL54105.1 Glycosyl transferase family 2 [Hymenobacter psychrotolerans DSM 18569]
MQEFPSLSIIIPSWNQGRFIERTLLSILHQDYPGQVQVIVSDGGSKDETVDILKKYDDQLIWWSAPDKGFVDAVTKGLAKATGDVLAIQSSDDYYLPGAFRKMAAAFQQFPEAGFVSGGEIGIDLQDNVIYRNTTAGAITPHSILFDYVPPQHATFVKRTVLEQTEGMRKEVDMCADIDLWYRVSHLAAGQAIPDYMAVYQLHPDQRTATSPKWYSNLVKMVETCEQHPVYSQKFRLNEEERRNLYTYWEINWTSKRDPEEARTIAFRRLPGLLSYSNRTRRMILGNTITPILRKVLPETVINSLRPTAEHTTAEDQAEVAINWWRNTEASK